MATESMKPSTDGRRTPARHAGGKAARAASAGGVTEVRGAAPNGVAAGPIADEHTGDELGAGQAGQSEDAASAAVAAEVASAATKPTSGFAKVLWAATAPAHRTLSTAATVINAAAKVMAVAAKALDAAGTAMTQLIAADDRPGPSTPVTVEEAPGSRSSMSPAEPAAAAARVRTAEPAAAPAAVGQRGAGAKAASRSATPRTTKRQLNEVGLESPSGPGPAAGSPVMASPAVEGAFPSALTAPKDQG